MLKSQVTQHHQLPRFEHFCPSCQFLGRIGPDDAWVHVQASQATFIKRHSSRPADYEAATFDRIPKVHRDYSAALALAKQKGIF